MNWSKEWATPIAPEQPFGTLRVKEGQKYREFSCTIIGDLALDYSDDGWNIYHVPTLALFSKAVPSHKINATEKEIYGEGEDTPIDIIESFEYDHEQLLNWMKIVQAEGKYPTAWQMLRQLTPNDYADKGQVAKDIILKWCLSVKVE